MRNVLFASCALLLVGACTRTGAPVDTAHPAETRSDTPASTDAIQASQSPQAANPTPATDAAAAAGTVAIALSGEGLAFVSDQGRVRHLPFGSDAAQAIDAVSRVYGVAPERGRNTECGAGTLDMASWAGGLTVVAQDGRFVGWSAATLPGRADVASLTTIAGIGPGSTRRELESAYSARVERTTLGDEFAAGDLFGVLEGSAPGARIKAMWAGTSCNFR